MEKDFNLATGLQTLFGENLREGVDNEAHLSIVTEESSGTRVDITIEDEGDMWAVKTETRIRGVSGISPGMNRVSRNSVWVNAFNVSKSTGSVKEGSVSSVRIDHHDMPEDNPLRADESTIVAGVKSILRQALG